MDVKKLLALLLVVFVGFWLFTDPNGLADTATSTAAAAGELISRFFTATISFVTSLRG